MRFLPPMAEDRVWSSRGSAGCPGDRYISFAYKPDSSHDLHQFIANLCIANNIKCPISNETTMEFNISELVVLVENSPGCVAKCKVCGQQFKVLDNVRRHFKTKHQFSFLGSRKRTSSCTDGSATKKFKEGEWTTDFQDADDFINNCLLMHTVNALPYAFWDKKSTKRMLQPFMDHFGVKISGKLIFNLNTYLINCLIHHCITSH